MPTPFCSEFYFPEQKYPFWSFFHKMVDPNITGLFSRGTGVCTTAAAPRAEQHGALPEVTLTESDRRIPRASVGLGRIWSDYDFC